MYIGTSLALLICIKTNNLAKEIRMKEQSQQQVVYVKSKPSKGIAAVINIVFPGAGHLYQGRVLVGTILFFLTVLGYFFFFLPGLVMHFLVVLDAFSAK